MNAADRFLIEFHRHFPGCTSLAFADGKTLGSGLSSYELLSDLVTGGSVLDLGCGDGHLLMLLEQGTRASRVVGLDFSAQELASSRARSSHAALVRAAGQALPFASQSFDLVVSHLAFHLMSEIELVVEEMARVLAPSGRFAAIVGGGPKLGSSFEHFLALVASTQAADQRVPRIGDMRARTEAGLHELFAAHPAFEDAIAIEDFYVDIGGDFEELWPRLATIYDLWHRSEVEREALREATRLGLDAGPGIDIPCVMAMRRIIARRRADELT